MTVTLYMIDETGKEHIRTIDITSAMSSGQYYWELRGKAEQRKRLELWIKERGNEQHKADLRLVSWTINR